MPTSSVKPSRLQQGKGSFFKLIDSFALEIGTLKKEMGNKSKPAEVNHKVDNRLGMVEEGGGLFLQVSPSSGMRAGLARARDSGYDSLHRRMSVLDRLMHTHPVWLQLGLSHQDATQILQSQPAGTFVVRKSSSLQRKVISLRMDEDSAFPIKDFPVKDSQYTFSLEGSGLSFADLFRLVAFCCISRDVLPFTLKLPEAIASAKTPADLGEIAQQGAGFWDSQLCPNRKSSVHLSGTAAPDRPPPPVQRQVSLACIPGHPQLRTRTPAEIECCQANGALCFINPLFIKVHQLDSNHSNSTTPSSTVQQPPRDQSGNGVNSIQPQNTDTNPLQTYSSQTRDLSHSDGSHSGSISTSTLQTVAINTDTKINICQTTNIENLTITNRISRSPPPRPPPPRLTPQHPDLSRRGHCSMPEKIPWIKHPEEKMEERVGCHNLLSSQDSSFSFDLSSSPPNILNMSSPVSVSWPSVPLSMSTSPQRTKSSPSSSQDESMCHLPEGKNVIENVLIRAKLSRQNAVTTMTTPTLDSSSPPDNLLLTLKQTKEQGETGDVSEGGSVDGPRLSDVSLSSDSSDSLDFSQSFASILPPLYDPSPPTIADYTIHLPLSYLPFSSMGEGDEEGDDEDDQEPEPDYGVNVDSDLDQEIPRPLPKRRSSAGALVIQKALQGKLRKMSVVFRSLRAPEKRAIHRVVELSKDKTSYFGCLVLDYLSYMGEGAGTQAWQAYTSGLELLQTLRQFITQMKSYLRQSSELEPPIESIIPEDHIDSVLEKALHKCILKPLKPIISVALQEFQVRSGEWQEMKDNLLLAKARQPQELGVGDASPPDPNAIQKIKRQFHIMCKYYSPEKKVAELLSVCKLIYTIMENNSGRLYGADDFLPVLTYVLAQCDMPQLDNEILYMMELLDPSLLQGEGGYYLTSAYGAMSLIRNFQEEQAARVLSSETRNTLCQWHRRRTTQRSIPAIEDFQNYLRVALQELDSGCTAKTLQVCPYATVEEVCQLCAQKFKVSDPENYALFLVTGGSSQQLAPDTHPQKIKADLHSRSQAAPFHFVFRRMANQNTSVPLNPALSVTSDPQDNSTELSTSCPQPSLSLDLNPSLSLTLPPNQQSG